MEEMDENEENRNPDATRDSLSFGGVTLGSFSDDELPAKMARRGDDDRLWGSDSEKVGDKGPPSGDDESDPFPLKARTKGKKKDSLRKALGKVEKAKLRLAFSQVKPDPQQQLHCRGAAFS